ncbi:hypothetical protein BD310DRAFT_925092 [Dichomitus squalens]|uniref:Uncharacterized protein n=1 Tax=Dichomitus squalens TaxID=114155 RepID=A0A4Q9PY15_9APHY|nr:hypothetical protein BD310DRAFT_925092 [Dichomitus squalens]
MIKATRYLLDGAATPDRSLELIWFSGVQHPGCGLTSPPAPDRALDVRIPAQLASNW